MSNSVEVDAQYVLRSLDRRLSDPAAGPMFSNIERDFSIVRDEAYFSQVATNIGLAGSHPTLPGLEDTRPKRQRILRGVARARSNQAGSMLEQIQVATFDEDTCRSLFRATNSGVIIPVAEGDNVESFHARATDYIEEIFGAAEAERIPLSGFRRARGIGELQKCFYDRDKTTVLELATLAGRNAAKKREFWLGQLAATSDGLHYLSKKAVDAFSLYAAGRPLEYMNRPDLFSILPAIRKPRNVKVG